MPLHKNIPLGELHVAHNWEYADQTAREAATGFVAADVGKLALQLDNYYLYMLIATTPTWQLVSIDATAFLPAGGTTDQVLGKLSGSDYDVDWITQSGGGGGGWTQVVDEDGTSFTNWTGASGTWSSASSVIKQTDTAAAFRFAKYNTKLPTSLIIFESEIQIKSSGADRIGGIVIAFDGSSSAGAGVRLNQGSSLVQIEVANTAPRIDTSHTINIDTWYKLRAVVSAGVLSAYVDGTLIASGGNNAQQSNNANFIGLYTYQAEVWFRNLKSWNLELPA